MGYGDGDLMWIEKDDERRPSSGSMIRMCRELGIEEDDRRTIYTDDAWDYFYELFARVAERLPREGLHNFFGSYLLPEEVNRHLAHLEQLKRKTA